ncbi:hypothetical protein [Candidatus Contubernalis alkaliaceticus]|uniref:hypothetical protein n=1 Tax=Candidatus Contubernalis alkaliaceticus TaxID=338645 RepID=UPI001F4C1438|nr:hypothetical protein [Candidatus Contubernalis alkalaceticus]UNC91625.1 hypothetical protein HUE98_05690 [Candidatus Contubernalis alkalaceticus]
MRARKDSTRGSSHGESQTSDCIIFTGSNSFNNNRYSDNRYGINKGKKQGPIICDNLEKEKKTDLKTVVLWIYNVNQNGSANIFQEELSQYLANDEKGSVSLKDFDVEKTAEFLANLSMSKEVILKDLGIRLLLFIINCNQNGSSNSAEVNYNQD